MRGRSALENADRRAVRAGRPVMVKDRPAPAMGPIVKAGAAPFRHHGLRTGARRADPHVLLGCDFPNDTRRSSVPLHHHRKGGRCSPGCLRILIGPNHHHQAPNEEAIGFSRSGRRPAIYHLGTKKGTPPGGHDDTGEPRGLDGVWAKPGKPCLGGLDRGGRRFRLIVSTTNISSHEAEPRQLFGRTVADRNRIEGVG